MLKIIPWLFGRCDSNIYAFSNNEPIPATMKVLTIYIINKASDFVFGAFMLSRRKYQEECANIWASDSQFTPQTSRNAKSKLPLIGPRRLSTVRYHRNTAASATVCPCVRFCGGRRRTYTGSGVLERLSRALERRNREN